MPNTQILIIIFLPCLVYFFYLVFSFCKSYDEKSVGKIARDKVYSSLDSAIIYRSDDEDDFDGHQSIDKKDHLQDPDLAPTVEIDVIFSNRDNILRDENSGFSRFTIEVTPGSHWEIERPNDTLSIKKLRVKDYLPEKDRCSITDCYNTLICFFRHVGAHPEGAVELSKQFSVIHNIHRDLILDIIKDYKEGHCKHKMTRNLILSEYDKYKNNNHQLLLRTMAYLKKDMIEDGYARFDEFEIAKNILDFNHDKLGWKIRNKVNPPKDIEWLDDLKFYSDHILDVSDTELENIRLIPIHYHF